MQSRNADLQVPSSPADRELHNCLCSDACASNAFMLKVVRCCMTSYHLPCPRCRMPLSHAATATARLHAKGRHVLPSALRAGSFGAEVTPAYRWNSADQSVCRCGAPAKSVACPPLHSVGRGGVAHSFASHAAQQPLNVSQVGSEGKLS